MSFMLLVPNNKYCRVAVQNLVKNQTYPVKNLTCQLLLTL